VKKLPSSLTQNLTLEDAIEVDTDDECCGPGDSVCAVCRMKINSETCFWITYHGLPEAIDAHCCNLVCLRKFLSGVKFLCFNWN